MHKEEIKPLKKVMKDEPFKFLLDIYKEVEKETYEKTEKEYFTWTEHYNTWIDIIQPILIKLPPQNSLLIFRFMEFNKNLLWIQTCVFCGQYYPAIRELRYALESVLKAYYLDKRYPNSEVKFKVEKGDELRNKKNRRLIGGTLINELNFDGNHKSKLNGLYHELCKYAHPTKDEFKYALSGEMDLYMTFSFNQTLFNKCVELTNKVTDVIFFVTFCRFPSIIPEIKNDKILKESLKELNCNLSLNFLKKAYNHNV